MQVPKIFVRSTKFLGKALLGLLVVLLLLLAIVHLPPVQKQITHKLANYLSSKIESKVDIHAITFSLLGNVAIADLTVWDPTGTKIFSAQKIEVASSIYKLVTGDFIFDQVHIEGAEFKLIQHEAGLNIQFIIDAFKSDEKPTIPSTPTMLQFRQVVLENVLFGFTSVVRGVSVDINLGKLTTQEFELTTYPLAIKADQVFIQQTFFQSFAIFKLSDEVIE